jgi:hypothetical protein
MLIMITVVVVVVVVDYILCCVQMPAGSEVTLAYIINTSEYCSEVAPQLQQMVQQKMNEEFKERVDYDLEVSY